MDSPPKRIIIFDFNQTLYDPAIKRLVEGTASTLRILKDRGYLLHLISHDENDRVDLLHRLGLQKYFEKILIVQEKKLSDFAACIDPYVTRQGSYVVGDRVKQEIVFGNQLGMNTVWVARGPCQRETPMIPIEEPTYTISTLTALLRLIR